MSDRYRISVSFLPYNENIEREVNNMEKRTIRRRFGKDNMNWTDDFEFNIMFLRSVLNYESDRCRCEGYLFVRDFLMDIKAPVCRDDCIYGWIVNDSEPWKIELIPTGDHEFEMEMEVYDLLEYLGAKERA